MNWTASVSYRELIALPEVQRLIEQASKTYKPTMSGEDFLKAADKLKVAPGVSLSAIGKVAMPAFAEMGIKANSTSTAIIRQPIGRAIVATLCSFAKNGQTLERADQGEDGVILTASLASDMWSFGGTLALALSRDGDHTKAEGATKVPGQMYDWGKGKRAMDSLFKDIDALATLQP